MLPAQASADGDGVDSSCGYLFEWLNFSRFPLQTTAGVAAYSYLVQKNPDDDVKVGYLIKGEFPYGTFTTWDIYQEDAKPFDVKNGSDMAADEGSENPFVGGTPMLTENRDFTLLIIPDGFPGDHLPENLMGIQNTLRSPTDGKIWALAVRLYGALDNEVNMGGYFRDGRFPTATAYDLGTGEEIACPSLLPGVARQPDNMPNREEISDFGNGVPLEAFNKRVFLGGPTLPAVDLDTSFDGFCTDADFDSDGGSSLCRIEWAPELDPELVQFTRPPLAPGAAVPSIPAPDACSGYLGAPVDPGALALIRIPQLPSFVSSEGFAPDEGQGEVKLYPDEDEVQVKHFSMAMYGADVGLYLPGSPYTSVIANEQFRPDRFGGATILVWPRGASSRDGFPPRENLTAGEKERLFRHARRRGWVLMRGGERNNMTTANILVRQKGAAKDYPGRFTPNGKDPTDPAHIPGVTCFYGPDPDAPLNSEVPWYQLPDDPDFQASPDNMGAAAPQGVVCESVDDVLDNDCERRLRKHIRDSGGRYRVRSR